MARNIGQLANIPTTKEEIAARGLQVAVRNLAIKSKTSKSAVLHDLADFLNADGRGCNYEHIALYHDESGLPDYMISGAIHFFKSKDVLVHRHQLKPTKSVLAMYGIYK